jgi:serine/threonine protein kinase
MPIADYEILEEIGAGQAGVVYRARQVSLNRVVALKLLRGVALTAVQLARFRQEAVVLARLEHPNIVPIYDVGEHEGQLFFAMKLLDGPDLARSAESLRRSPLQLAALLASVARAVHHAHQQGILHRDLKPANIVLDAQRQPHLVDFGLAHCLQSDESLTSSGVVLGTPSYLSPEQATGRKDLTAATDIFSMGVILYELLTGKLPFAGDTPFALLMAIIHKQIVPPRRLQRGVPRDLEAICLKCLEKAPDRRYGSAAELADDLERVAQGKPSLAGRYRLLRRLSLRNLALALTGGLVCLLLVATWRLAARWPGEEEARLKAIEKDMGRAWIACQAGNMKQFFNIMDRQPPPAVLHRESRWLKLREDADILRPAWICELEQGSFDVGWSTDGRRLVVNFVDHSLVVDSDTGQVLNERIPRLALAKLTKGPSLSWVSPHLRVMLSAGVPSPDGSRFLTTHRSSEARRDLYFCNVWDLRKLQR